MAKFKVTFKQEFNMNDLELSVEEGAEFLLSFRGRYLLGQALNIAIPKMEEVPENRREISNIADMKALRDSVAISISWWYN